MLIGLFKIESASSSANLGRITEKLSKENINEILAHNLYFINFNLNYLIPSISPKRLGCSLYHSLAKKAFPLRPENSKAIIS